MSDNERTGPHKESPSEVRTAARQDKTKINDTPLLNVATAPSKDSRRWEQQEPMTWGDFLAWLDMEHPASERECGGYVPALLRGGVRKRENVVSRSILTLDADKAMPSFLDDVARLLAGTAWAAHTTWRHGIDGDRYRLLVPLSRPLDASGYRRAAEAVRDALGEHWGADKGCPEPERFMYRPSTQGHYCHRVVEGGPLDVDRWLAPPLHPYAAKAIEAELLRLDLAQNGARNDTTFEVACVLVEFANSDWSGYTLERAEDDLLENAPVGDGFDEAEVAQCWASAVQKVGDKARPDPGGDPADDFDAVTRAVGSTWSGLDLTGFIDGTHKPVEPEYLLRDDGVALLYPGLTHSIHGESESGKSMVAQYECVQRLRAGEAVLYLDFESDPSGIVERLRLLGADMRAVAERFVYLQPASDPHRSEADNAAFLATLDAHPYSLAVVDGVSESMDVLGLDIKDPNASAIEWARKLPRFVADRTGAAVVQIDHVTKNAESRGRFAIGGQAKMSALTGAAYALDVKEPIGRGLRGRLVLRVAKDRPGYVRGKSGAAAADRTQEAATVVVDSTGDWLQFSVLSPPPVTAPDEKAERMKERVAAFLAGLGEEHDGASLRLVRSGVTGKNDDIDTALNALVAGGWVSQTPKGQSLLHKLVRPYVVDFDDE
jgi:hypothetical protein